MATAKIRKGHIIIKIMNDTDTGRWVGKAKRWSECVQIGCLTYRHVKNIFCDWDTFKEV